MTDSTDTSDLSLAITIVTHKRPDILARTLKSLETCSWPDVPLEVMVLENGDPACGSETLCAAAKLPIAIHYAYHPDNRKPVCMNHMIKLTNASLLVLLDDDVRLHPNYISAYLEAARRHGRGYFFGGPHSTEGGDPPPEWLRKFLPVSAYPWGYGDTERILEPEDGKTLFMGFNWAAFRSDILDAGGFLELPRDISSSGGGDETEMQRRLLAIGARPVYIPEARVWHLVPDRDCNVRFAIERARFAGRNGFVLNNHQKLNAIPGIPPAWLLKRLTGAYLRSKLSELRTLDIQARLPLERTYAYYLGILQGYCILRKARASKGR